jgi:hypothetical protein
MTKTRIKLVIALALSPLFLLLALIFVRGLGQFLAYFHEGADPASIFRGNALIIPSEEEARWLSTAPQQGIAPSKAQQDELIAAYWGAWQALSRAYETGLAEDLSSYWALPILEELESIIPESSPLFYQTERHQLEISYFSDDRSIASLFDSFILQKDDIHLAASAETTLSLDNGRWRIRLLRIELRSSTESLPNP